MFSQCTRIGMGGGVIALGAWIASFEGALAIVGGGLVVAGLGQLLATLRTRPHTNHHFGSPHRL